MAFAYRASMNRRNGAAHPIDVDGPDSDADFEEERRDHLHHHYPTVHQPSKVTNDETRINSTIPRARMNTERRFSTGSEYFANEHAELLHTTLLRPSQKRPLGFQVYREQQENKKARALDFILPFRPSSAHNHEALSTSHKNVKQICATWTRICDQMFGRCEFVFDTTSMELLLWQKEKRVWKGEIKYAHLERFSFYRGSSAPPYLLLMEFKSASKGYTAFSEFYDSLFAKLTQDGNQPSSVDLYGAAFYFEEEMDYVRCRSLGESNEELALLFQRGIPETEAKRYLASYTQRELRPLRQQSLRTDSRITVIDDTEAPSRTSSFHIKHNEESLHEQKFSMDVDAVYTSTLNKAFTPPRNGENANIDEKQLETDSDGGNSVDRRSKVLLRYPYEDSESPGSISVTIGDVERLAPGEFLNDNLIDFYLRSHFFTQLIGNGRESELMSSEERFARVARWTQKETNLFDKQFLFIPINDSFHWSIAIVGNPGSAIVRKRRRQEVRYKERNAKGTTIDLVDDFAFFRRNKGHAASPVEDEEREVIIEEELETSRQMRMQHPPCLLFLDSLRCHRKKKFSALLRGYLECEFKVRCKQEEFDKDTGEWIITSFDSDSIDLIEPNIPLQTNSSDCGVFLLMYAAEILRRFPAGVTHEDLETKLASSLTKNMFDDEHVLEFREYLHQLLYCLQSLQHRGIGEKYVKEEELESFVIER